MSHDCGTYLPSYESVTIFHLRDIAGGKRRRIKEVDVKVITVPFFEGLKIETMLEYAAEYQHVMEALPTVKREREKLPRGYLANLIYTIVGEAFKQWVERRVNERHEERRQPQDQIQMDPEIARVFNESQAVAGKCPRLIMVFGTVVIMAAVIRWSRAAPHDPLLYSFTNLS